MGKATIYRRYRSKDELITAAVAALVSEITVPDTGSTRADLLALMRAAVDVYRGLGRGGRDAEPDRCHAAGTPSSPAWSARDSLPAGARRCGAVLERGVERGDLRADLDLDLALDVLGGPLFYRLLITGGPIDERLAEGVVELILRGFAPTRQRVPAPEKEAEMNIHAIQTGSVAITTSGARARAMAAAAC